MWPLRVLDSMSFLVERSDMKECGWTRRGAREGPQEIGNQDLLLGSMDSQGVESQRKDGPLKVV